MNDDSLSQNFGCFSPDGTKLYLGETHNVFSDLVPYDTSTFIISLIFPVTWRIKLMLPKLLLEKVLGRREIPHDARSDDRIYTTTGRKLSVILSPEATGGQCNLLIGFIQKTLSHNFLLVDLIIP